MKRKLLLLLIVLCFMLTSCDSLVNSAMSLKDEDEQLTYEKQQLDDLESENNSDEAISKSIEIDEQQQNEKEEQPEQTPTPKPVENNNPIVTDIGDFKVSVASFDVSKNVLENNNTFYEAIGFDSDKNLVIRYATAVVYSNTMDENPDNDSMRVTIDAFDADDNMLWKEQQEFSDFEVTELGDFSVLMVDKEGNLIIENLSYNSSSTLRCLNYKNGNVNWATSGFSVSIDQDNDGNYYYVTYYGNKVTCLDNNGNKKWAVDYSDGKAYFWPTLAVKGDKIVISCTEPTNNGENNIKLEYSKDGKFIQKIE